MDDEPDITALVAYHLAKAGYRVSTAASGTEALRAAREERPDLVILDLMLPGRSGFDVLADLRGQSETKDVGVILLTARKDEPDRIKGLSLGADHEGFLRSETTLIQISGRAARNVGGQVILYADTITGSMKRRSTQYAGGVSSLRAKEPTPWQRRYWCL